MAPSGAPAFQLLSNELPSNPQSRAARPRGCGAMQHGRLWLLVLAIRGVHSDPNPVSALKGDPPNPSDAWRTSPHARPGLALRHRPASGTRSVHAAGQTRIAATARCASTAPHPGCIERALSPCRHPKRWSLPASQLSSPTSSPCLAACARARLPRARSSVWRRCSAATNAASSASATSAAVAATAPAAGAACAHVGGASRRDHLGHGERPLARR